VHNTDFAVPRLQSGVVKRIVAGVVPIIVLLVAGSPADAAHGCGKVAGGQAVIVRGSVSCATARQVLRYAATHFQGNGPASPHGWQCSRIPGSNPGYNGNRCIGAGESEARPRKVIEYRY
jgi:hypothetical protein